MHNVDNVLSVYSPTVVPMKRGGRGNLKNIAALHNNQPSFCARTISATFKYPDLTIVKYG